MADQPAALTLAEYVKATGDDAKRLAAQSEAEADALVSRAIGATPADINPHGVPLSVIARAKLDVGADLYNRQQARNGVIQMGAPDVAQPIRINRDPLAMAREMLDEYLPLGFA